MEHSYGKGTLVPTGKGAPSILVDYRISQQPRHSNDAQHSLARPSPVVHSIAVEAGQPIELGDYDLLVGESVVRLKHIASDPNWLVLSSDVSAICD